MQANSANFAYEHVPNDEIIVPSTQEFLSNFNDQEEHLRRLLEQLNNAFEEKLAILATKQLLARMSQPQS